MIGQTLAGRFTIVGLVGVGSMGKVYRAVQRGTERNVALKVLRKERARDSKAKARFLREARASSSLASPHTVRVFDFGESEDGELFLAMELLDGESVADRIKRDGRLGTVASIETALAALKSLEEAHAKGLIHRDLKPANLFYARVATGGGFDEITKVLDFGGAKFIAPEGKPRNALDTQEGFVVGTPRYMSPEQAEGLTLDGRSDLYSLGTVLYHMITGRAPFTDDDPEVVLSKQIRATPERPRVVCPEAEIPIPLDALIMRVLSKDMEVRPRDATAFLQELLVFVDGPPSVRLSAGVLRSSTPPPPSVRVAAAVSGPTSSPSGPSSAPSGPSGSGRPSRPPSSPSISDRAAWEPPAQRPPAASEPDPGSATLPLAAILGEPRWRLAWWLGALGTVAIVAAMAWFASARESRVRDATAATREASAKVTPATTPTSRTSGALDALPVARPAPAASSARPRQTAVPVEALPHAHTATPSNPAPARLPAAVPPPPVAPKPAERATTAPPPAPPSATATSNYHYFE